MLRRSSRPNLRNPATRTWCASSTAISSPRRSRSKRRQSAPRWTKSWWKLAGSCWIRSDADGSRRYRDPDSCRHSRCRGGDHRSCRRRRSLCGQGGQRKLPRCSPCPPASTCLRGAGWAHGRGAACAPAHDRRADQGVKTMTDDVQARIADVVKANEVLLFMKGSPLFPQCGFSSRAIAILDHLGVEYGSVDVLQDQGIRQGIKQFSDWPTIPQLYVKGEFVGGSDIMMEMYESGELQQLFAAA